jgi:hypothetical protein
VLAACWSVKGGSGTSVVAASLALVLARDDHDALLVDLDGDAPAVLGLAEPSGPGVADWLAAGTSVPSDGLARLEVAVADGLALLPRGGGRLGPPARAEVLAGILASESRSVVVDCGTCRPASGSIAPIDPDREAVMTAVVAAAGHRLLVTRACYLSLRRIVRLVERGSGGDGGVRPSGIVLVSEPGRALGRRDVEDVAGVPVVAEVPLDPAVARAIDAGLLAARLPRVLDRALGQAR